MALSQGEASQPSLYVTLVSNDGFEFVVRRECAYASGTLKRMLDPNSMSFLILCLYRSVQRRFLYLLVSLALLMAWAQSFECLERGYFCCKLFLSIA